jgi:kynurenine 3-monooxygenase
MSDYHQEFFGWVYKEFNLSKAQAKSAGLALDGGHVWPRGDSLLLGLPNSNGTLTCNLIVPREGHYSFSNLDRETALSALILENFKELAPFVSSICKVTASKTWSGVVTMKTRPWSYRDKVVLVGDAAHAVVHFYAQGLND